MYRSRIFFSKENAVSIDSVLLRVSQLSLDPVKPPSVELLRDLIAEIRPRDPYDAALATERIHALCFVLKQRPACARALRNYLTQILVCRTILHLLTDTGITENHSFGEAAWRNLAERILPPLVNDEYVKDVFRLVFTHRTDYLWVSGVADETWRTLLSTISLRVTDARACHNNLTQEILSAVQVLSYRITNIGLEAELVRNYPEIERFESPFLRQNDAANDYVASYTEWLNRRHTPGKLNEIFVREDSAQIEVLLSQCEEVVLKIRRNSAQHGVSVSLTRLLLRLSQSVQRLRTLLALLDSQRSSQVVAVGVSLFKELVQADNKRNSLRELIRTNTELLSLQMTERAGRTGEHYATSNRAEWLAMLRSAMGAGFIVGFMALIKILFGTLALAPFGFAVLYSLNYSFGFMLVHILHFTIATKQPAMTAALIANSIDQGKQKLDALIELIVRVCRSQFIAIIGNIALAMPVAYVIAWAWYTVYGTHLVSQVKAEHLLHDLNPLHSLALPHAAIAGVCLFLSGLISGYYDNKASYSNIPARLRQLHWPRKLLGEQRLVRVTNYIGDNLGALMGNFFFGVMLGSIGQLGVFFGLPIDIRHITFASANFAFALVGLDHQMSWQLVVTSLVGIMLIGVVNLSVSFSLAILVALRSRRISFGRGGVLTVMLLRRFRRNAREFFFPPKSEWRD
jgi:site-specific recombinase